MYGPANPNGNAILLNINQLYRQELNDVALYDITRGIWKLGVRRLNATLALAIVDRKVKQVYTIQQWHPAGTTPYASGRNLDPEQCKGRWEFTGEIADKALRRTYVGFSVASYFHPGARNPVRYVDKSIHFDA